MTESTCPANDLGLISRPMSADTETSTAHFEGAANHSANHSRDGASGGARAAKVRPRFTASKKTSSARLVTLGLAILLAGGGIAMRLRAAPVKAAVVARGTAVEAVYATGTVEPFERVIVKARAAGTIDLKVREGDRVRKGDLLALIDSPTLRHELDRGRADFWAASHQAGSSAPQLAALKAQARSLEAELHTVRGDRGRELRLVASGSAAQAELDRLVDKSASLEAELAANVAVDSLAARLSDTEVRAPMDGVVLSRFVEPGELVMVNSPLLKVGSGDNLVLECAIDEADIGRVALGSRVAVSLYAFPQAIYQGELFEISPDADRVKRSFLAKVKLIEPPAGLRSGMTTEVNVVIDERPGALLVPADAVDANGGVLVVANGRIQRRTPQLGVHDLLRVEVTRGLSEGEQVVVEGGDALDEGARVTASVRPPSVGRAAQPGTARAGMSL
jgi:RND family efflux transporter MFP subunit